MATNYYNAQIGVVDASGNVNVIYPITKATNVDVTSANYGGSSATTVLQTALNNLASALSGKAPTSHASTGTSYGIGNASNYGHVKLTDTYSSVSTSQKAANAIGASAWALQTAYTTLNSNYIIISFII